VIDTSSLPFFLLAAFVVIVIPGPSVFYIVARSLDQGRAAGIVSTLGVGAGALFHVAAAGLGLSAVLASSAVAFNTIKYLGAAYLVYLGLRRILHPQEDAPKETRRRQTRRRMFSEGLLVNLLNPKTALFFFAFLPQFVEPSLGPVSVQVMVLGCLFVAIGILSDGVYALLAGGLGDWFRTSARLPLLQRYLSGGVYIALGVATAVSDSGRSK